MIYFHSYLWKICTYIKWPSLIKKISHNDWVTGIYLLVHLVLWFTDVIPVILQSPEGHHSPKLGFSKKVPLLSSIYKNCNADSLGLSFTKLVSLLRKPKRKKYMSSVLKTPRYYLSLNFNSFYKYLSICEISLPFKFFSTEVKKTFKIKFLPSYNAV